MKYRYKLTIIFFGILIILGAVIVRDRSRDVLREIEGTHFSIIRFIESSNSQPVYLAAKNTCISNSSTYQCSIECGFGNMEPCYFFKYDTKTQKPHVIATYYSKDDALYQTLMEFKSQNIIQFVTKKDLSIMNEDHHYISYTKELDTRTGKISVVKQDEIYEPYESNP